MAKKMVEELHGLCEANYRIKTNFSIEGTVSVEIRLFFVLLITTLVTLTTLGL